MPTARRLGHPATLEHRHAAGVEELEDLGAIGAAPDGQIASLPPKSRADLANISRVGPIERGARVVGAGFVASRWRAWRARTAERDRVQQLRPRRRAATIHGARA